MARIEFELPTTDYACSPQEGLALLEAFTTIRDRHARDGITRMAQAVAADERGDTSPPARERGLHG